MPAKKDDRAMAIVNHVLSQPVPPEGSLKNPFAPKKKEKRQGARQIDLSEMLSKTDSLPDDIKSWSTRTFVDYFAMRYQEATGGNYRRLYRSDCQVFVQIQKFLGSNGLEKAEWTKKVIDWSFERHDEITRRVGYFTPNSILAMVNYFYQDQVLPQVEEGTLERGVSDTSLVEEMQQAEADGKATEMFARYGIPVTFTYLSAKRGLPLEKLTDILRDRLISLLGAGPKERLVVERIFQSSVIGAPYPDEYARRDWREVYEPYTKLFRKEAWWRDVDSGGKPLPKYYAILDDGKPAP